MKLDLRNAYINGIWHSLRALAPDLLMVIIILLAGAKFTFGLENYLDVTLFDETYYLYRGVELVKVGVPQAALAPLYSVWYYILGLVIPNRISLYYLNYKLMTVLPTVLVYILLRKNKVPIITSLIVAWLLLMSGVNANPLPKVSHFALILLLGILTVIDYKRSFVWVMLVASIGALLVSFVRPEYFLAYLLFLCLLGFGCAWNYKKLEKRFWLSLSAFGLFSGFLLKELGIPISGDRSMVAFGQHFSVNWIGWSGSTLNPWTNWQEIVSRNFGPVHSLSEAFLENPSIFLKHIATNLELVKVFFTHVFPPFFPVDEVSRGLFVLWIVFLPVVYLSNMRNTISTHKAWLIITSLFLLPEMVSIAVIYPRDHYLLILGALLVVLIAVLINASAPEKLQMSIKPLILLGLIMLVLTPQFVKPEVAKRPNLETIQFIRALEIFKSVRMLEAEGGYHVYLGDNFSRIAEYDKNSNFDVFLVEQNINMIVVSNTLLSDTRFKDDPAWQNFLIQYSSAGYVEMSIPNTDRKLLVRADLLGQ